MDYKIAVIPGDGIGKEVITQAKKILERAAHIFGYRMIFEEIEGGGEYYSKHGVECPPDTLEKVKAADGIIKGPMGVIDPATKKELRREDGQIAGYELTIGFRRKLELFAIVRPGLAYKGIPFIVLGKHYYDIYTPDNLNMVIVREGTEDAYQEEYKSYPPGEMDFRKIEKVTSEIVITRKATERVADFSFELARSRRRGLVCADKSNALKPHEFFREVVRQVSEKYPDVKTRYEYADNFTDNVLKYPNSYDVVLTPNMIGDIISDEVAGLQGGRGIAPSVCIGHNHIMAEAIHGTAYDIAGKDIANPFAMSLSAKYLIEWLGNRRNDERLKEAANAIEETIKQVLIRNEYRTTDIGGKSEKTGTGEIIDDKARCSRVGDAMLSMMEELF